MFTEEAELAANVFETNQLFARKNEIVIPTHYGVLLRPNHTPLVISANTSDSKISVINFPKNKTSLKTDGIYHCGVISITSNSYEYKMLAHAPTPKELGEITNYLLSQIEEKLRLSARLYINYNKGKQKFPKFVDGPNSYRQIYEEICKNNNLVKKEPQEIDETFQVIC